jgi:hypothetical protein
VTEQPVAWSYSTIGATYPGVPQGAPPVRPVQRVPSSTRQPKLAPAPVVASIASISSRWSWPTSPMRSVGPSNENFQGLRRP